MRDNYRLKQNKKAYLFPQEWLQFWQELKEKQQPYFKKAINTGARIDELRNTKITDYKKTPSGMPYLTLTKTKVRAKLGETKPTPREFTISTEYYNWIKRYHKRNKQLTIPSTPAINKLLKNKLKKIGKDNWQDFSSHNIRKTHGNWLLALGIPHFEICNRLGHDVETLRKHYASPTIFNQEDKKLMRQILGDLYENKDK